MEKFDHVATAEIAKALSEKLGITNVAALEYTKTLVDIIRENLSEGKSVRMTGLGTLELYVRSPKNSVNPQTGEKITVPAKKVVRFRPSGKLEEDLNGEIG